MKGRAICDIIGDVKRYNHLPLTSNHITRKGSQMISANFTSTNDKKQPNTALSVIRNEVNQLAKTESDFVNASEALLMVAKEAIENDPPLEGLTDLRAQATAIGTYLARKIQSREARLEAGNNITESRLRIERAIGSLIKKMQDAGELSPKNGNQKTPSATMSDGVNTTLTLAEVGVSYKQSSRWQTMATLPEEEFEEVISTAKENGWELTSYDMTKKAKDVERDKRRECIESAAIVNLVVDKDLKTPYKTGDIVFVGIHILICGDNTSLEVRTEIAKHTPVALAFCDPPYNAGVAEWDNGDFKWGQDYLIDTADIVAVTPGIGNIPDFMRNTSMPYKWSTSTTITNGMTRGALGFGNWIYTALFSKQASIHRNSQDIYSITINASDADELGAKRQKPPMYLSWLFNLLSDEGETILDPFGGSGISVIVANNLKRRCICIEKDEQTFNAMVARIENAVGIKAAIAHG